MNTTRLHHLQILGSIAGLALAVAIPFYLRPHSSESEITPPAVVIDDLTGDNILDVAIHNPNANQPQYFIGTPSGTVEKASIVACDGIGFFRTANGVYDTLGQYLPNVPLEPDH